MSKEPIFITTSSLTSSNATRLPQIIKEKLSIRKGDKIAFFHHEELNLIIITRGKQDLSDFSYIGGTTLSATGNITIVDTVRELMQINNPQEIAYFEEPDRRISIVKGSALRKGKTT